MIQTSSTETSRRMYFNALLFLIFIADCGYVYDVDFDGGGLFFEQQTRGFMWDLQLKLIWHTLSPVGGLLPRLYVLHRTFELFLLIFLSPFYMYWNSAALNVAHQEKDTRKRLETSGVSPMTAATSRYTFLHLVDWQLLFGFHW